jgi:hypothetical protein
MLIATVTSPTTGMHVNMRPTLAKIGATGITTTPRTETTKLAGAGLTNNLSKIDPPTST